MGRADLKSLATKVEDPVMAGTNDRRKSIVDEEWEPIRPQGPRMAHVLTIFVAALVVVPLVAFFASYTLLSR